MLHYIWTLQLYICVARILPSESVWFTVLGVIVARHTNFLLARFFEQMPMAVECAVTNQSPNVHCLGLEFAYHMATQLSSAKFPVVMDGTN